MIVAQPYDGVKACDLRLADDVQCCLFCDVAVPLRIMFDHVAEHIAKGDTVVDARHRGKAEPCGFCGRSTGTSETTVNGTKVCTNCPYRYSFKYKKALQKKRNVPRKCPVPMCPASPFTLNIKYPLRLVHPGLDPETIEVSDWADCPACSEDKGGERRKGAADYHSCGQASGRRHGTSHNHV